MEETRTTHDENPQLVSALHQKQHREKESKRIGFMEEQSATSLGWEENSTSPPTRGVAPIGIANVDKTTAMPNLRLPWRFPARTHHRQGWLEAAAGEFRLQSHATTHLR
jgi:hypothetical protein